MNHRILLGLIAAAATACYGYGATPVGSAEVTTAPIGPAYPADIEGPYQDIYAAPQVMYEGRPTYFYQDRWYYRDNGGRWNYYRSEPNELRGHRRTFESRGNVNRMAAPRQGNVRQPAPTQRVQHDNINRAGRQPTPSQHDDRRNRERR